MTRGPDAATRTLGRSADNTFASLQLDRVARRRRDPAWVAGRLEADSTRFLLVQSGEVLTTPEPVPRPIWLKPRQAREYRAQAETVVLLGEEAGVTYVALGLTGSQEDAASDLRNLGIFSGLRKVAPLLDGETAALLAYAKAMVHYHHEHRYCTRCGSPSEAREGGHLRVCTRATCGHQEFPRTDPAIIVLVNSGEHCLLGRQPTWPETLYSIIAGFVEPGESLESAVAREVKEETGIQIRHAAYHSSQPWPFPRSLMIGFTATAQTATIRLRDGELAAAQWLTREDIVRKLKEGTLRLPSPISISHRLIQAWFDAAGGARLTDVLASI